MPPLLRYDVMTTPFPLQASPATGTLSVAQLTLVVSNPNPNPVTLQGLILNIPVGTTSTDLTPDATGIGPVPPTGWTLHATQYPTGAVQYLFYPQAGSGAVGSSGLSFSFNNVQVNRQTGTVTLTVTEGSNNCDPATTCPTVPLDVTKFPNGWGQVTFWSNPNIVSYDGSATLHWAGPAGATYTIEYYTPQTGIVHVPGQGQPPLGNQGQYPGQSGSPLQLTQNTTFYLSVAETTGGQTYSAQEQSTVTVEQPLPTITQFTGSLQEASGSTALVLNWDTQHANYCLITGNPNLLAPSSLDNSYKIVATPENPLRVSYTLTAFNATGQTSQQLVESWASQPIPGWPSRSMTQSIAVMADDSRAFVSVDQRVGVLDISPTAISIETFIQVGNSPSWLALAPDMTRLYVLTLVNKSVQAFDTTTYAPVGSSAPLTNQVDALVVAPSVPPRLCVSTEDPNGVGSVTIFDPNTLQPINTVAVGAGPRAMAASPDGKRVYVSCELDSTVWVLDLTATPVSAISHISVGNAPLGIAVSPDSTLVLVVCHFDSTVWALSATGPSLTPIGQPIAVGTFPWGIAISGSQAYVTNMNNGSISMLDLSTQPITAVLAPIQGLESPTNIAAAGGGLWLFVAEVFGFAALKPQYVSQMSAVRSAAPLVEQAAPVSMAASSAPLLRYDVMTTPFPLQASPATGNLSVAQLTLVVSNPNPNPVTLQGLILSIPVGDASTDLTPDATGIGPVPPAGWTLHATQYPTGAVQYLFYPQAGSGAVGSSGLSFIFNNVQINRQTGTATLTVTEGSNNCDPATTCPTVTLDVTKFPNGWGQVALWVDPPIVAYGGSTTLHWAGPADATYTIEYYTPQTGIVNVPAQGQPPLANQGQYPGSTNAPLVLGETTVFTLNVSEAIGGQQYQAQNQETVTVAIPAPVITTFTATLTALDFDSDPATMTIALGWTTANTTTLTIDSVGVFQGDRAEQGSTTIQLAVEPTITFTATGQGLPGYSGSPASADTPPITLPAVAINSFTAATDSATLSGQPALVLRWDVANVTALTIAQAGISVQRSGLGPLWGCTALQHPQNLAEYTLTTKGFKALAATPQQVSPGSHPDLKLIPSDDQIFSGFQPAASTIPACRYSAADQLMFGWGTALVAPLAEANRVIGASALWPMPFSFLDSTDGLQLAGRFNAWQMTLGGAGQILRMSVPMLSGTVSAQSIQGSLDGSTAIIELRLSAIPYVAPAADTPDNTDPAVVVVEILSPPDQQLSPLVMALAQSALAGWFNQNLAAIAQVLQLLNPTLNAAACPAWLQPTAGSYCYIESTPSQGYFVLLAVTMNQSASGLPSEVSPQLIAGLPQTGWVINEKLLGSAP